MSSSTKLFWTVSLYIFFEPLFWNVRWLGPLSNFPFIALNAFTNLWIVFAIANFAKNDKPMSGSKMCYWHRMVKTLLNLCNEVKYELHLLFTCVTQIVLASFVVFLLFCSQNKIKCHRYLWYVCVFEGGGV